jgi:polyadenylate-binding protein
MLLFVGLLVALLKQLSCFFLQNLDKSIDNKALYDTFCVFGSILSCKIATDPSGESRGYGFVQFERDEAAQVAIDKLNGMLINDKKVYVGPFVRKQDRENVSSNVKFSNVYVKNLGDTVTDDELKEIFGKYGTITSAVVMCDSDGKSRCFGFVNFENVDDAAQAVEELNGKVFNEKELYVGRAQKKSEREMELKEKFEKNLQEVADKYQNTNLYLKNLEDTVDDDKLSELFAEYGTITSCKVCVEYRYSLICKFFFLFWILTDHVLGHAGFKWCQQRLWICCFQIC